MKAAVFRETGKPLAIENVEQPRPGSGELLLRVAACGICGTDLHVSSHAGLPAGSVMGHEFAGEIVELGPETTSDFEVGDRVTALPFIGCGRCEPCLSGDGMLCATTSNIGLGENSGGFAEYVRVSAHETLRVPDGVDTRTAALAEPLAVGRNAVNVAGPLSGSNVLVLGAGPIGLAVTAWARFDGARAVVVSEPTAARRALAPKLGATGVIDARSEDVEAAFTEQAGGPPDVIFECAGVPGMLMQCVGLARHRGKVVVAGVCMEPDTIVPVMAVVKELQLNFALAYRRSDFQLTLDMLAAGRIRAAEMITDVVKLDDMPGVFETLKSPGDSCKVLVEP